MMRVLVMLAALVGVALIVLISRASGNTALFDQHYASLIWVGMGTCVVLGLLIAFQIFRIARRFRASEFGSRLAAKLIAVFALMALLPGAVLYTVSSQFLNRSIDSWFDVRIDGALESALSLGRGALDIASADLSQRALAAADILRQSGLQDSMTVLDARRRVSVDTLTLYTADGKLISRAVVEGLPITSETPSLSALRQVPPGQVITSKESLGEEGLILRALVRLSPSDEASNLLALTQRVPVQLGRDAMRVERGYADYQKLVVVRDALKRLFALALTLALLLTLFSAIALSFVFSEQLSAPLSALAEATRAVARGDYTVMNPVRSRDEFGVLTQSFNTMTRRIADVTEAMEKNQRQVSESKAHLETILGNLSSGVLSFDARFHLRTINDAAQAALGDVVSKVRGLPLAEWSRAAQTVAPLADEIVKRFADLSATRWEAQLTYARIDGDRALLVRGARLPGGGEAGYVVVFDDVTNLVTAERKAAWGEVARRLAHEIKNPLTPIQLSAERLQVKLKDKLAPTDSEMLTRSTNVIVGQVAALKGMVDDFSQYARAASIRFSPCDLNALVSEVSALYEGMGARIVFALDPKLPPIEADPAMLRQVLHNLLTNAVDAVHGEAAATIRVSTQSNANAQVALAVQDNGCGVADSVRGRVFEPYITTKPKGTGLGLAIVKRIVDEHHGEVSIADATPSGTVVRITLPVRQHAYNPKKQEIL